MNFIIAFLGVFIYWLIIKKENKVMIKNSKHHDNIFKPNIIKFNNWKDDVIDIDLENKFKFEMCTDESKIYKITSPIICSIDGFPNSFNGYVEYFSFMKSFPNMVKRAYMGYYNKVLYNDAMNGIRSPDVYTDELKHIWRLNHEFMKWLNCRIKSTNNNFELKFVEGNNINTTNCEEVFININDVNCDKCVGGKYCWAFSTNIISVF